MSPITTKMGGYEVKKKAEKTNIIKFHKDIVASCPLCKGQAYYLLLNRPGLQWEAITGFECMGCGDIIEIKVIK